MIQIFLCLFLLLSFNVFASDENKEELLKQKFSPGQEVEMTVKSEIPIKVGWSISGLLSQADKCPADHSCAVLYTDDGNSIKGMYGAAMEFKPVKGEIKLKFKNLSSEEIEYKVYKEVK